MEPPSLTREPRCPFWVMAGILRQLCLSRRKQGRLRKFGLGIGHTCVGAGLVFLCRDAASRVSTGLLFLPQPQADSSAVALPEKVRSHRQAHGDNEGANPGGRKLLSVVGAEISA